MHTLTKQMKAYIEDGNSPVETLYHCYLENNPGDNESINVAFGEVDSILSRFTLQEYDRVWDAVCRLCDEHERRGFLSGLQIGTALMLELCENNQQKDTCF